QLFDALADVVEGAVAARLLGGAGEDVWVPAAALFLHRRDVDRSVVQVLLDLGQVGGEETSVHADGVAGEGDGARLGDVRPNEVERGLPRVGERDPRGFDGRQQPALRVHRAHDVVHPGEHVGRLVDDEVGALGNDLE